MLRPLLRRLSHHVHVDEFFVGQWSAGCGDAPGLHAWVVFERNGERFLFETVNKDQASMIRPLSDARSEYSPHFSVDHVFTMRSHAGYLLYLKKRSQQR